jgi:hypothetical protein
MTDTSAPDRIERDGDVAVVVLDNPPLNLFTPAVFNALENVAAEPVRSPTPVTRAGRAPLILLPYSGPAEQQEQPDARTGDHHQRKQCQQHPGPPACGFGSALRRRNRHRPTV